MTQSATIAELLGGRSVLKRRVAHDEDLAEVVRAGIPAIAVGRLAKKADTTLSSLYEVVGLKRRTFERRVSSKARLKPNESDSVVRVARAVALATSALGNTGGIQWLHRPNRALGDRTPWSLLDTDIGARQVEQILGRIEHGVFS